MKSLGRFLMIVGALVAGSLLFVACGGGEEELSLDEYFRRVEEVADAAEKRVESLEEEFQGTGEDIEAARDYAERSAAVYKEAVNDFKSLHPPAEAREAHDEFAAVFAAGLPVFEEFADQIADAESVADLQAAIAEFEDSWEALVERSVEPCLELQALADENDIDVDLECE